MIPRTRQGFQGLCLRVIVPGTFLHLTNHNNKHSLSGISKNSLFFSFIKKRTLLIYPFFNLHLLSLKRDKRVDGNPCLEECHYIKKLLVD